MAQWQYTKGLHDIGNGLYAYLLPDGSWGWSNAGLIVDGEETRLGIGDRIISGLARFQTCDDEACGLPQTARFEVPVRVEPSIVGDFGGPALRNKPMHGGRHWHRLMSRYDRLE